MSNQHLLLKCSCKPLLHRAIPAADPHLQLLHAVFGRVLSILAFRIGSLLLHQAAAQRRKPLLVRQLVLAQRCTSTS
jgi:hypothetical protein